MPFLSPQAPTAVVMVIPRHFRSNPETATDNSFQSLNAQGADDLALSAHAEARAAAERLIEAGVLVHAFEDDGAETPDSVFPNNWFSTHAGGHVAVYPMLAPNRRKERRQDILDFLKNRYRVQNIIDYSGLEQDGLFLEGTGAMVLDHIERVAYAARSKRTNEILLERFCAQFNYEPMVFDAVDGSGAPIYHTNVLMCVGTSFTMIGLDCIADERRRSEICDRLTASGREVVRLSQQQIAAFAGNALEVRTEAGPVLALSQTALRALQPEQVATLEHHARLLELEIVD